MDKFASLPNRHSSYLWPTTASITADRRDADIMVIHTVARFLGMTSADIVREKLIAREDFTMIAQLAHENIYKGY